MTHLDKEREKVDYGLPGKTVSYSDVGYGGINGARVAQVLVCRETIREDLVEFNYSVAGCRRCDEILS